MKRIFVPTMGPSDWRRLLADPEKQWKPGVNRVLTAPVVLTVRRASIIMMTTTRLVHGAAPALTDQGVLIRQLGNTSMGLGELCIWCGSRSHGSGCPHSPEKVHEH